MNTFAPRIAGLDGLRGIAVAMVLVYHLWPTVLPGGFLGVTVFFALSGFLLTHRLLGERARTGRVAIGAFYARRARRILPVAVGALGVITVIWTLTGQMTRALARDLHFGLLQIANWGQFFGEESYGAAASPSPVLHYWSLAIEEQTYLVVPVLLALLSRRGVGVAMVIGLGGSLGMTLMYAGDPVAVYFSTFTRVGEFCAGALAAVLTRAAARSEAQPAPRRWVAVGALAALIVLLITARLVSTETAWLYRGGLWAAGVVAAVTVMGAAHHPGVGRWLDLRPLADLGRISYGVYVVHWPILIGLGLTNLNAALVPWVTLGVTLVVAQASFWWVETPLLRGAAAGTSPRFGWVRLRVPVVLVLIGLGAGGVASLGARQDPTVDFEALSRRFSATVETAPVAPIAARPPASTVPSSTTVPGTDTDPGSNAASSTSAPPGTSVPPTTIPTPVTGPLRYSYFGDSKALTFGFGISAAAPEGWSIGPSYTPLGCPLSRGGAVRHPTAAGRISERTLTDCDWQAYLAGVAPTPVDVVVLWYGTWDAVDRRLLETGSQWHTLDSAIYRAHLHAEFDLLIETLIEKLEPQVIMVFTAGSDDVVDVDNRAPQMNRLWAELVDASTHPVFLVDLADWVAAAADADRLLPDGIHPTFGEIDPQDNTAAEIHDRFIDPTARQLLAQVGGARG